MNEFTIIHNLQKFLSNDDSFLEKDSIIKFYTGKEESNKFIIEMEFCPFGHLPIENEEMIDQFAYNSIFL